MTLLVRDTKMVEAFCFKYKQVYTFILKEMLIFLWSIKGGSPL